MGESIRTYLAAYNDWEMLEYEWEKSRDDKSPFGMSEKLLSSEKGAIAVDYYQNGLLTRKDPVFWDQYCNMPVQSEPKSQKSQQPTQY